MLRMIPVSLTSVVKALMLRMILVALTSVVEVLTRLTIPVYTRTSAEMALMPHTIRELITATTAILPLPLMGFKTTCQDIKLLGGPRPFLLMQALG